MPASAGKKKMRASMAGNIPDLLSIVIAAPCDAKAFCSFFFFHDTAPTEIYTLSLHDALPISLLQRSADNLKAPDSHRALRSTAVTPTATKTTPNRERCAAMLRGKSRTEIVASSA